MLGKKPNKVYDLFLKVGLGYQNPKRLKKVIKEQPKMYNGDTFRITKLDINSPDSEETLENAEEKFPVEQTDISTASTSNVSSESSEEMSDVPKNEMLILEIEKISSDSKDIQATMDKRIKILENDFTRVEA
ncbi:hypothetical protein Tco_1432617 [Tanacetum coccineum]